jgi:hypothetical protein
MDIMHDRQNCTAGAIELIGLYHDANGTVYLGKNDEILDVFFAATSTVVDFCFFPS